MQIGYEALVFLKETTGLSDKDLRKLYHYFKKIDLDRTHIIDFNELCMRIKCEETVFLRSIFDFFITDSKSYGLIFPEFVIFVCYLASLNERGLAKLCFFMLAHDALHTISVDNIEDGIKHLMRGVAYDVKKRRVRIPIRDLDVDQNGTVTLPEFMAAYMQNKSVLQPVISYQMTLRNKVGRYSFWNSRKEMLASRLRRIFYIKDCLVLVARRERRKHGHHRYRAAPLELDIVLEEA